MAFELSYVDFSVRRLQIFGPNVGVPAAGTVDSHAVSISAIGLYPIRSVDLFGRIGLARWKTSTSNVLPVAANRRSEGTDPSYGIGAQVNLSKVSLRAEYEQFKQDGGWRRHDITPIAGLTPRSYSQRANKKKGLQ